MGDPNVGYDYGHGSCFDPHQALLNETSRNARDSARGHADILRDIGLAAAQANARFCDTIGAVKDASKSGETTTIEQSGRVTGAVRDGQRDLERATAVGFAGVQKSICDSDKYMAESFGVVRHDLCDVNANIAAAREANLGLAKDASALAYQIEARASLTAERIGNAIGVQAERIGNSAQVQLERVRAELAVQADKNAFEARLFAQTTAAAAELRAQQIACEAAKQLADCCCELKEQAASTRALVSVEANATRALITDNRMHDLERKLADAKESARFAEMKGLICCGCPSTGGGGGHGGGNGNGNGNSGR